MMRTITPYLLVSLLIMVGGAVAYDDGTRVWAFYLAIALAVLVPLPAYIRWDSRREP